MDKEQAKVEKFNQTYPVGTKVMLIDVIRPPKQAFVEHPAEIMCGTAVAWFAGVKGAYDIDCVHPTSAKAGA